MLLQHAQRVCISNTAQFWLKTMKLSQPDITARLEAKPIAVTADVIALAKAIAREVVSLGMEKGAR